MKYLSIVVLFFVTFVICQAVDPPSPYTGEGTATVEVNHRGCIVEQQYNRPHGVNGDDYRFPIHFNEIIDMPYPQHVPIIFYIWKDFGDVDLTMDFTEHPKNGVQLDGFWTWSPYPNAGTIGDAIAIDGNTFLWTQNGNIGYHEDPEKNNMRFMQLVLNITQIDAQTHRYDINMNEPYIDFEIVVTAQYHDI